MYFQDEASIQYAPTITRMWGKKGKQPKISTPGGRKRQPLSGAVDPIHGKVCIALAKSLKSEAFIEFLDGLLARNRGKKVILYTDNAKAHHSKKVKEWLEAREDYLEVIYLPKYSPDWNPQEAIWKKFRKAVTHNTFFRSFKEFQRAIVKYFMKLKKPSLEIISLCKYEKLFNTL